MHARLKFVITCLMVMFALPAMADEREPFYGQWGTENQCARKPIKPNGTFLAEPFEINRGWLKHGQLWCKLNWLPVGARKDGLFASAHAQCGEDSVRDYLMRFTRSDNDELTISWNFTTIKGPLKHCPVS